MNRGSPGCEQRLPDPKSPPHRPSSAAAGLATGRPEQDLQSARAAGQAKAGRRPGLIWALVVLFTLWIFFFFVLC